VFLLEVIVRGRSCIVRIDGETVAETNSLPDSVQEPGRIGLQSSLPQMKRWSFATFACDGYRPGEASELADDPHGQLVERLAALRAQIVPGTFAFHEAGCPGQQPHGLTQLTGRPERIARSVHEEARKRQVRPVRCSPF